ncbi:MAG: MdtA/MuxA family multidrug efflux RND transporter periplasmic adaptor subunit [Candidatus Acidiferrales bacterium]
MLVAVGFVFYRLRSSSEAASKKESGNQTISVGVVSVQRRDVPYYLTGLGTVTAFNTVTVHTRVDGQIMQVLFKEGQFVHAGDVLIQIDPRPYQVALDQAEGQLAKDEASQNDAKVDLNRYQTLWQDGVVARQQLDTQQATVGQYDGSIKSDIAQINSAKLNLVYSRITSPINGRVGLRLVDPGNIVHATDTNGMLVITQVQPTAVDFTLPEEDLPEVVAGMRSRQLVVDAYSSDDKTKLAEGKLLTLDNEIDQTTGTIKLKSQFENTNLSLWPNQFVNTRLFLNVKKNAVVVPSATIQTGAQGSFVYVIGSDNHAEVRPVQVDFNEGNISVIRQGLQPGEVVVVDGADKLQSGSTVTPHQSTLSRPSSASSSSSADQQP